MVVAGLIDTFVRGANDFASAGGLDLELANLNQLLGTEKGELPHRPEFGLGLERLRHVRNDDALAELAAAIVRDGVTRWTPNLTLLTAAARRDPGTPSVLNITLSVRLRAGDPPTVATFERTL